MRKFNLEELKKKEDLFLKKINEEIELKKSGITPTQQFLKSIEESIKKSIENKISFTQISKIIFATFNIKISTQTIRAFAITNLDYKKEIKKENINPVAEKIETKTLSVEEMKKVQSSNLKNDDDSL